MSVVSVKVSVVSAAGALHRWGEGEGNLPGDGVVGVGVGGVGVGVGVGGVVVGGGGDTADDADDADAAPPPAYTSRERDGRCGETKGRRGGAGQGCACEVAGPVRR